MARELPSIYLMIDPRDSEVRYVGYSSRPSKRRREHLSPSERDKSYRAMWIRGLASRGLSPLFVAIEATGDDWQSRERYWIAELRAAGHRLTNGTEGGEGVVSPTAEVRQRMRDSHLGIIPSEETRLKRSQSLRGQKRTPEQCERYRLAASRRRPPSEATKQKIADAVRGTSRPHSPETRAKMSESAFARAPITEETRTKLRDSHFGFRPSPESIEKTAAAHRGTQHSAETKARMSLARLAYLERKKGEYLG